MAIDQEERDRIRANVEVSIIATLSACSDDADYVVECIRANDLPLEVLRRVIALAEDASGMARTMRDEADMSIRADAHESLARLG